MSEQLRPQPKWDPYEDFDKKKSVVDQGENRKQATIESMTDEQRMEEFAHTGNPEYLTPALMQRMQVEIGSNGEPRSTTGPDDAEVNAKILADHGVDISLLRGNDVRAAMRALIPIATASVHQHTEPLFDAKDAARDEISRLIFDRPEVAVGTLFKSLDPKTITAIETARYIQETLYAIKEDYRDAKELGGSDLKRFPKVLRAFHDCAEKAQRDLYLTKNYYGGVTLAWHTLNGLYEDIKEGVDRLPERYTSEPFELTTGTYAAFSEDRNRIYVASPEDSTKTGEIFHEDFTRPYAKNEKKNRDWRESRAFRLLDARNSILDSGALLTDLYPNEFAKDPALLRDFITLTHPTVRKSIESPMSVLLSRLSIREQLQLLKYVRTTNAYAFDELRIFGERFREPGLRTFLLTADDKELRQKVYEFTYTRFAGDNRQGYGGYSPVFSQIDKIAQKVFGAYGQLVKSIDGVGDYLREQFGAESSAAVELIVEKQLSRARGLLSQAHDFKNNPDQILHLVESVQVDTQLFLDSCRALRQQGILSLEDIRDGSLEVHSGNISEDDASAILKIQEERYRDKYPEAMQKELREGLSNALKSPYAKFYLYRKNGEIITYVRFDQLNASSDPEKKHMASFMTNPKFEGGALGQAMLELALEKELEKGAVYAECDPSLVPFYEKFGFIKLRQYKDEHGVATCDIVLESQAEILREAA